MLPIIGIMIATYGSCALLQRAAGRHEEAWATATLWVCWALGTVALWLLVLLLLVSGSAG